MTRRPHTRTWSSEGPLPPIIDRWGRRPACEIRPGDVIADHRYAGTVAASGVIDTPTAIANWAGGESACIALEDGRVFLLPPGAMIPTTRPHADETSTP